MSYDIDLSGRVALVTGASSGLGAQFARVLAKAGAGVALAGRRVERLKSLRAEIEAEGGDAHVVPLDVTDYDGIKSAVAHTETDVGTIDILINNSGVATTQKLVEVTPEDFDYMFDVNVRGAFFVAQEVGQLESRRESGSFCSLRGQPDRTRCDVTAEGIEACLRPDANVMARAAAGHTNRSTGQVGTRGQKIHQSRRGRALFPTHFPGLIALFPVFLIHRIYDCAPPNET